MNGSSKVRLVAIVANLSVLAAASVLAAPARGAGQPGIDSFAYTGAAQTWSVPPGVQTVFVEIAGGQGGDDIPTSGGTSTGGAGDSFSTVLAIPTGATALEVNVGGDGKSPSDETAGVGGWNGGGNGGSGSRVIPETLADGGAGGGGATDIRLPGDGMADALVIAGGGGGGGGGFYSTGLFTTFTEPGGGGGAGGLPPGSGQSTSHAAGGGGGVSGSTNGLAGQAAISASGNGGGGGGGGGFQGGGGGGTASFSALLDYSGGGGGGGSSKVALGEATPPISQPATSSGVTFTYNIITPPSFAGLALNTYYTGTFTSNLDDAEWQVVGGTLPPGLWLNNGVLSGSPTTSGTYTFTVSSSATLDGVNAVMTAISYTVSVPGGTPTAAATGAAPIGTNTAKLNGMVTGGGFPIAQVYCKYATTALGVDSGTSAPASPYPAPSSMTSTFSVSCPVAGLVASQLYYYKVYAMDTQGSLGSSTAASFTTGSLPPDVTATGTSQVRGDSAIATGTITATNQPVTSIQCRYATTAVGVPAGTVVTASPATALASARNVRITCALTGLTPNTRYFYGVFAADADGPAASPSFPSFTTARTAPIVESASATAIGSSSAQLTARVTATNQRVTAVFCRYAKTESGVRAGTLVSASPSDASSTAADLGVSCSVSGLQPSTTYYYRLYASDGDGTGFTPTAGFTTTAGATNGDDDSGTATPSILPVVNTATGTSVTTNVPQVLGSSRAIGSGFVRAGSAGPVAVTCRLIQPGAPSASAAVGLASPPVVTSVVGQPVSCAFNGLRSGSTYSYVIVATSAVGSTMGNSVNFATTGRNPGLVRPPSQVARQGVTVLLPAPTYTSTGTPISVSVSTRGSGRIRFWTDARGRVLLRTYGSPVSLNVTYRAAGNEFRRTVGYQT